jgi:hypothetical protein
MFSISFYINLVFATCFWNKLHQSKKIPKINNSNHYLGARNQKFKPDSQFRLRSPTPVGGDC